MTKENGLEKARLEINKIDEKMADLFVKRMKAVETILEYKKERGLSILDKNREGEVIRKNSERVEDLTLRSYYVNFLEEMMSVSKRYQESLLSGMKVAYSGTEGAFAHIAAEKLFPSARKVAYPDFTSAYRSVESGECELCVLPIENSSNGEVGQVTDLMFSGTLYVNGVLELPITHDLLGVKGADISDVREVVSHAQALGQCRAYIREHGFSEVEYVNTALAAKEVAERGDKTVAAIASAEAADIFGLEVLDHDINETKTNTTRFAVFSRIPNKRVKGETGVHSILMFTVRNEAGALAKAIDVIGKYGFNMRTLRSRPMKELLWEYYFYIEAEGNVQTEEGLTMMEALGEFCAKLKFAGTYIKM